MGQGRVSGELRGPHMVGKAEGKGSVKSLFYSCGKNPMNQAPPKPLSLDIIALGVTLQQEFWKRHKQLNHYRYRTTARLKAVGMEQKRLLLRWDVSILNLCSQFNPSS